MKLTFALPFILGLGTTGSYAQQPAKAKPATEKVAETKTAEQPKAQTAKEEKPRLQEFDNNFRAQEFKTRNSIYTLGGKLTPPGKKHGEGC